MYRSSDIALLVGAPGDAVNLGPASRSGGDIQDHLIVQLLGIDLHLDVLAGQTEGEGRSVLQPHESVECDIRDERELLLDACAVRFSIEEQIHPFVLNAAHLGPFPRIHDNADGDAGVVDVRFDIIDGAGGGSILFERDIENELRRVA